MRVKFSFRLSEPLSLSDRWPIKSDDVIYSFDGPLNEITGISATILGQPIELSPTIAGHDGLPTIRVNHGLLLLKIREKLDHVQCALGTIIPVEIDMEHYEVQFEPETADEESKIKMRKWGESRRRRNNRIDFNLAAKGLLVDSWPRSEREVAQFYRRGRAAINERFFVDAFVNYYFFLERLYAGGKFRSSEVARRFSENLEIQRAFKELDVAAHNDAAQRGAPLGGPLDDFCEWIVDRRGFFQHQSETDPNRWLHSTQEAYLPEALLIAMFALSIYNIRNECRLFGNEMEQRWMKAAEEMKATMEVIVEIFGNNPHGEPVRHRIGINGPGTRVTREMARQILAKSMQIADEKLISIRQMTAAVKATHELIFSYSGPADPVEPK